MNRLGRARERREELAVTPFLTDRLRCFASPRHSLARKVSLQAADFAAATLLIREDGSGTREVVLAALNDAGIRFGRLMPFGTIEAIKQAVTEGLGVSCRRDTAPSSAAKAFIETLLSLEH